MHCLFRARTIAFRAGWFTIRRARPAAGSIAALAVLATTAAAHAQSAEPLRLADVLEIAQQANPQIDVVRERAAALRAVPAQVSAYDDPTLSWEGWNIPDSLNLGQAQNNIFRVAQKIPWPGKRTLAGTVATHTADAAQEDVRVAQLDLDAAVKRAYYDLWLTHQTRDILTRDQLLVERVAHTAEQKYATGEATQPDALRAQVELTHMAIQVNAAALAIDTAAAELNALLGRRPDEALGVPEDPRVARLDAGVDTLTDLALQQRPELAEQRAAIAREQSGVELAAISRRPDFEFSFGRFVNYGHNDGFGAMASVTVPFVYSAKYDAASSEARARLASAEAELRRWQDRVRREVVQAYARVHTAALQHGLTAGTHVPQAEQALRVTEAAYQTGRADFAALLDTVRNIEAVHLQHVGAEAELVKATADLERAVGGALPQPPTVHQ
jgi:outer membrane protein TolC